MHGYFLSLQLYDTARLIANPFVYEEHRERMVQAKMDKMAETRIRAPKHASVKVNKALADKIRREEEREKKRAERKVARKAKVPEVEAEAADGMVVDEVPEEHVAQEKPTLLSDPRFKALFENPEFEVDEDTLEFALLNPSSVAHRQTQQKTTGTRRTKTAVEEEEEESDKASSDGSNSDDGGDGNSSGSEDSDIAGGTFSFSWC